MTTITLETRPTEITTFLKPSKAGFVSNPAPRKLPENTDKCLGELRDTYGNEFSVPTYTIQDLRKAIPAECFERSAVRGLSYVFRDVLCVGATLCIAQSLITTERVPSLAARVVLWNVYGFVNGLFGTGIWVLAHECGHQALSNYKVLNDTVGFILHSLLLVPYFSWKISHGKHHKATGHMEREMVFIPRTRSEFSRKFRVPTEKLHEIVEDTPIWNLSYIIIRQVFGWPVYLLSNDTGHDNHERQPEGRGRGKRNGFFTGVNHLNPDSPIFEAKDAKLILLSDLGLLATMALMYLVAQLYGWSNVFVWYILPYVWVNNWLVFITFLQHTDPQLPHYTASSWTFVRGAAATIDRDFGFIGRHLFHGIMETHVLHHYVSTIPFYHADKATEAIKRVMGRHYRCELETGPLGVFKAMYRNFRMCQWVEPSQDAKGDGKEILFFRNHLGLGPQPLVISPES